MTDFKTLEWKNKNLILLDQRLLPHEEKYITCRSAFETADAIRNMVVRGAPAIGIAAAYGIVLAALKTKNSGSQVSEDALSQSFATLRESRPTAVNLFQALDQMLNRLRDLSGPQNPCDALEQVALKIHQDDREACLTMAGYGASLLQKNSVIYTHCNAGALATGGIGTAVGIITQGHQRGFIKEVMVDETRPWLQGARLTAWELKKAGVPFKLAVEGAAGSLMRSKKVDWVIVGADRIAANGDVANKVGTYNLAILAKYHGIKVMVAAPMTTIDWKITSGKEIPIETRDSSEITHFKGTLIAPSEVEVENPVFDITPAELIDVIVTDRGVVENPNKETMKLLLE